MADKELQKSSRWRGWIFFHVTASGGANPRDVADNWTIPEVLDAYHNLQLRWAMESF
jgi:hypothetical protein